MENESPSVVCICQGHEEVEVAAAVLGNDNEEFSVAGTSTTKTPESETANVLILGSSDGSNTVDLQHKVASPPSNEFIIVTTIPNQPLPNTSPIDLFLSQCLGKSVAHSPLQRALGVLHAEVGDFGGWLSHRYFASTSGTVSRGLGSPLQESPKLHYDINSESLLAIPALSPAVQQVLQNIQQRTVMCVFAVQTGDAFVDHRSFQKAVLLAREVQYLAVDPDSSLLTIASLAATEHIVPARPTPQPGSLPCYQFPTYGTNVLLVIPTENTKKKEVLEKDIMRRAPSGTQIHTITLPVESHVGEQPYNVAGSDGARNRVANALVRLQSPQYAERFSQDSIGSVIVASIENYVQTEDIDRPADFAIAIVHNVTTNETRSSSSRGVTIAPWYVDRARRFGTDGNTNHGNVTVGKIMAARVPQLDDADWHRVVAGISRYDLLAEAVANLQIPW